jgi:hypothetical protein
MPEFIVTNCRRDPNGDTLVIGNSEAGGDEIRNSRDHWSGAVECASYDVNENSTWTARADMLPEPEPNGSGSNGGGRWHPTLITLSDGRILAVAGHPHLSDQRHGSWMPEIYDVVTDTWTYVGGHWLYTNWVDIQVERIQDTDEDGEPIFEEDGEPLMLPVLDGDDQLIELREFPEGQSRPTTNANASVNYLYYPRIFVVPGGLVFMASPNDYNCRWHDTNFGRPVGPMIEMPPHDGGFAETNHTAVLLPLLPNEDPNENYRPRILFMGSEGTFRVTLNHIDMSGINSVDDLAALENLPTPEWEVTSPPQWESTPPLRRHGCATLLPTGAVFFSGGINQTGMPGLDDDNAALHGEIYFPEMNISGTLINSELENWITVAAATVPRNYHSVALLLPNGRVLTAGSNLDGSSGGDDVKEYRIETYSPVWYWDDGRPEITQAPEQITYAEEFTIETSNPNAIIRTALMRCGTVTHAWDGDQRYIGLEFETIENGLRLIAPPNGSIAPPGPYMLWIISAGELPCKLAPFMILN